MVDEHDRPLRAFADSQGVWRYQVELDSVSPLYIESLLNYEDRWFWLHPGVNPFAMARALWLNVVNGKIVSGGSTLSMQVARLLHPHDRTLMGKMYQVLRTFQLEWHLSKREILGLYLNMAPFGGTLQGVEAASQIYLDKSASHLTHAEAALLTVLPQAPTRYRPDRAASVAQRARDKVLDRMVEMGVWTRQTVEQAKKESVYAYRAKQTVLAPLLARRLTALHSDRSVIRTFVDSAMQASLAEYVKSYVSQLPQGNSAAVLVMDNETGAVKAYVGSADFTDDARFGHVDMVNATRSPGSTLKPFLYAMALDEGLIHSHSLLADAPRVWGEFRPSNFGSGFSGPVSAAAALQRSLNVPFIDVLDRVGQAKFIDKLAGAGLRLQIPGGKPNLAVILGAAGSKLSELVGAYSSLARQGLAVMPRFSRDDSFKEQYLMSEGAAWVTHKVLSEVAAPGTLNSLSAMASRRPLAWKTGTSYGHRDSWAIGVSTQFTIGVWIGRPDGTPSPGQSGAVTAGPLLFAISRHIESNLASLPQPSTVTKADICWPLGTLKAQQSDHCHQKTLGMVGQWSGPRNLA